MSPLPKETPEVEAENRRSANGNVTKDATTTTATTTKVEAESGEAAASCKDSEKSKETKTDKNLDLNSALQYLANGKRALLISDTNNAVSSLETACQLFGEHYGETAVECGEAYFFYGKSLLELARMEAGVLENVADGEDSSTENSADEDESESPAKETEDVSKENEDTDKDAPKEDVDVNKNENEEDSEKSGAELEADGNESIASNDAGTSNAKEEKDKSEIEHEEEDDPSNLQLAWEILELAKNCFQRQADSLPSEDPKRMDCEHKLSETFLVLGEVSVENENYPQAIDDLTSCLRRRQELLPDDSRSIAETHYQMGVAQGFNLEFDEAIASLHDAIAVLEKRIKNLKNKTESVDVIRKPDAFYTREREISEIESLLPDIKEKIADTKDMQNETVKKLGDRALLEEKMAAGELLQVEKHDLTQPESSPFGDAPKGAGSAVKAGSLDSKQTSDISHMMKKRKKSESGEETASAKKPHVSKD